MPVQWTTCFLMWVSISSVGSSGLPPLQADILTPTIYLPVLIGAFVYTGPAFDTALQDIGRLHPSVNITQHVIYDTAVLSCPEWEAQVDDRVASAYYRLSRNYSRSLPRLSALIFAGKPPVFRSWHQRHFERFPTSSQLCRVYGSSLAYKTGHTVGYPDTYKVMQLQPNFLIPALKSLHAVYFPLPAFETRSRHPHGLLPQPTLAFRTSTFIESFCECANGQTYT
ncbi:hypothetical protein RvY_01885-1 [Ramazzottius varieornatus]|uniref:Uncharacterized protein n=1 Tax=Ramazzottius varieornatus TaxID=947166 RepID=A0A1D1UI07_RAMVA|nr:hypothetical protein RvY_01885-1 [Ramazzottius varieornatus]